MGGLNKNRKRKYTFAFRVSEEERAVINAKIRLASIPIGEFLRQSALGKNINVYAGKYESDRLALELKRLGERLPDMGKEETDEDLIEVLLEVRETLKLLQEKKNSL